MRKMLFCAALAATCWSAIPAARAQTPEPEAALTASATPASAAPEPELDRGAQAAAEVNIQVESPEAAPPPPPQTVRVEVPQSAARTVEKEITRETRTTRMVEHQKPSESSSNMAYLLIGGGISALAVAGLYSASARSR